MCRIAFLTAEGARALVYVGRLSWRRTAASWYPHYYIHIVMFITCIHHLLVSSSYTLVECNTTYAQPPSPNHHDPSRTVQQFRLLRTENTENQILGAEVSACLASVRRRDIGGVDTGCLKRVARRSGPSISISTSV